MITAERRAAVMLLTDLLRQSGAMEECREFLIKVRDQAEKEGDFEMLTETTHSLKVHEPGTGIVLDRPAHLADL